MKPPRKVDGAPSLQFSEGQWDRDLVVTIAIFVPAAIACATLLLVTQRASQYVVVRRLATLGLGLLPVVTFAILVPGLVEDAVTDAVRNPSPTVLDAAVLLAGAAGAVSVVFEPLVALPVQVGGSATVALAVLGYVGVPFWLGERLLDGIDQFETSLLTVLLSLMVLVGAGGAYGVLEPLTPGTEALLVLVGVCGLFGALLHPRTASEDAE